MWIRFLHMSICEGWVYGDMWYFQKPIDYLFFN
jgi:hypothetical protein